MRYPQKRAHAACVLIAIAINLFSIQLSFGQSPGGVSTNLRWWLRADAQVLNASSSTPSTGEDVAQWKDQSSATNDALSAAGHEPTYQPSIINGYPVLRFTGIDYLDATSTPGISGSSLHYFAVFKTTSYWVSSPNDELGSYIIDRNASVNATPMASLKIGISGGDKYIFQERVDGGSSINNVTSATSPAFGAASTFVIAGFSRDAGSMTVGINGLQTTGTGSSATLTPQRIRVGCHATQITDGKGGLIGDLAEVVVYSNQLGSTERRQVESYLAVKYGITLDQTTPTDYLSSSGAVIYPAASSHDSYDKEIAGIGSDNNTSLNLTSSRNQSSSNVLTISNPSSLDNGDYLLWGHNSTSVGSSTNAPSPYSGRILRVWRAAETGDVGTVTVSFNLTGQSGIDFSDASQFALLIDSDGDFSNATIHTTGVSVVGSTIQFTNASINNNDYFTLATAGGSNLRWWLKADAGALNSSVANASIGEKVARWNDQSSFANNATQATDANRPTYQPNVINGNAVLRFSGDQYLDASRVPGINSTFSFFTVFKQNSFTAGSINAGDGTYITSRTIVLADNPIATLKIVSTNKYGFLKRDNDSGLTTGTVSTEPANTTSFVIVDYFRDITGPTLGLGVNGKTDQILDDNTNGLKAEPIRIGRHATTNTGLNGDFAEMMVYNKNLSSTERQQVLSYLAIKYGITLDQTTPTNYLSSSGTVVYPATSTHDSYDKDIAGIGSDNSYSLSQISSQSQNPNSILKISNPSSPGNGDYLIWGHNSNTVGTSTNTPAQYTTRLLRVWRAAETGDVGTVTISFDLTGQGIDMSDPADFALLIDSDGDFSNATAHTTGRNIAANIVEFTAASINNNDHFTLATDATILPITLLKFSVEPSDMSVVRATWTTAHEVNNDYFTLERSKNGLNFNEALEIPGAGNSNEEKHYEVVDNAPYAGRSYYRLKQTDYNGTSTYSEVKTVKLEMDPTVFPNPNDGVEFKVNVDVKRSNTAQIDILNASGLSIFSEIKTVSHEGMQTLVIKPDVNLLPGLYYLGVTFDGSKEGFKFIVR